MARTHVRSRELTDNKPLKTGGRLHVHMGRVHKGAGFEGNLFGAVTDIMGMLGDNRRALTVAPVYR